MPTRAIELRMRPPAPLSQCDLRLRPSSDGATISGHRCLQIINTGDVLDDVFASIVPDIDLETRSGFSFFTARPRGKEVAGCYQHFWRDGRPRGGAAP